MGMKKALLLSLTTILVTVVTIVGATFALFSDSVTVNNHLSAGTLEIKLERTNLEWLELDQNGYLETKYNTNVVDFTNNNTDNVFGLTSQTKVVPGVYYNATMKISNESSVAFNYWLEVKCTSTSNDLSEQIKLSVNNSTPVSIGTSLSVGDKNNPIGVVEIGKSKEFTVKITFEDSSLNNEAQGEEVTFDLVVYALQVTSANS